MTTQRLSGHLAKEEMIIRHIINIQHHEDNKPITQKYIYGYIMVTLYIYIQYSKMSYDNINIGNMILC